ncbi:hypothetical protein L596_002939 [Steinernema carpocapsae]|uniref:Nonsense-mediated mRNA decay factor SMG8 n=1 Tax=Steinernema carpocapsae TaxID=34508 RepID=A0A4U8UR49_STECR|nr:hypothetical protein L596_002939 [Steinernema carpocapsae]
MADDFVEWLDETFDRFEAYNDSEVTVVAVIGKESGEHSKSEAINAFLEQAAFGSRYIKSADKTTFIESYFAEDCRTVFLVLYGLNDVNSFAYAFENGESDDPPSFFETVARLERDYNRHVHLLFLISHIVLFVDPGCRFDVNLAKTLNAVNQIRKQKKEEVSEILEEYSDIPEIVAKEGRFAVPRLLFLFDRNPLRVELGMNKRNELLAKMQSSIERQITSILRSYKILSSVSRSCIGCLSDDRFVHVNSAQGWTFDAVKDIVYQCVLGDASERDVRTEEERKLRRAGDDFDRFLTFHLDHGVGDLDDDLIFCNPTMYEFLATARVLYRVLIQLQLTDSTESGLWGSKTMDTEYEDEAFAIYKRGEKENLSGTTVLRAYSRAEHEMRFFDAKEFLENHYTGADITKILESLTVRCEQSWENDSRPCEVMSVTGNPCGLPIHCVPGDKKLRNSQRPHANLIRFMSCCNCGKSQALRPDPFSSREANYDFYDHISFKCCRFIERHLFDLFDHETASARETPEIPEDESEDGSGSIDRVDFLGQGENHYDSYDEDDEFKSEHDLRYDKLAPISDSESEEGREETKDLGVDDDLLQDGRYSDQDDREQPVTYSSAEEETPYREEASGSPSISTSPQSKEFGNKSNPSTQVSVQQNLSDSESDKNEEDLNPSTSKPNDEANLEENPEETEVVSKLKKGSYLDEDQPITFRNPTPGATWDDSLVKNREIERKFRGQYLDCLPHTGAPHGLLPLFPSWACICIGSSSIYSHTYGMRDQPLMRSGSDFLLPLDVILPVNGRRWDAAMAELNITNPATFKHKRRIIRLEDGTEQEVEKVKLFIGFDYECVRGHRFMLESPGTVMKHHRRNGQLQGNATELLDSDLPIWMPCPCKKTPTSIAQLMRIHVVTPKAPVAISLNPKVQALDDEDFFTLGDDPISLSLAKYYILRLPFSYVGPNGAVRPPSTNAVLQSGCLPTIDLFVTENE